MSNVTTSESLSRSARRLRIGIFAAVAVITLLYAGARAGLQFGHARIVADTSGPDSWLAHLISDLAVVLLVIALFRLTQMLKRIADGDLFGIDVVRSFRSFAWWLLLMAMTELAGPFASQFANKPGGLHEVSFTVDSRDLLTVGVTLLLFLLSRLLERARGIERELREIV